MKLYYYYGLNPYEYREFLLGLPIFICFVETIGIEGDRAGAE